MDKTVLDIEYVSGWNGVGANLDGKEKFRKRVVSLLARGYQPLGPAQTVYDAEDASMGLFQTMVKYDD